MEPFGLTFKGGFMQALISWVMAHQAIVSGLLVGILDFVFAIVPSWASNGVLHWIYLQVAKLAGKAPPAS